MYDLYSAVLEECVKLVRENIGAVACFRRAVVVDRLPKTRSGKTLRATVSCILLHTLNNHVNLLCMYVPVDAVYCKWRRELSSASHNRGPQRVG